MHITSNVTACTNRQTNISVEAKGKKKNLPTLTHPQNNVIKRVGGVPWEPTGVCLWCRRGQVWGHTSSVSVERRVDHTNSIMATNTAMMRPQISTTKMPPMFSIPRPESEPQEKERQHRTCNTLSQRPFCLHYTHRVLRSQSKLLHNVSCATRGTLLNEWFNILGNVGLFHFLFPTSCQELDEINKYEVIDSS